MARRKPVNILYCEGNIDGTVGGSYFSLLYLISGLDRSQYNPLVVFHHEHAVLPCYHAAGIRTLIVPPYVPITFPTRCTRSGPRRLAGPVMKNVQKGLNFGFGFVGRAIRYAALLKRHGIDLVHLNNSVIRNNDWMLAALLVGVPCITHERGINNHYPAISRRLARRLKTIVCISGAVRERLEEHDVGNNNLVTIYNGIDPGKVVAHTERDALLKTHGIEPGSRVIGVVGNIKPWKGQEVLVRALPAILRDIPDLTCLFVGATADSDRTYHDRLLTLAQKLGVAQRLRFTGYTANVADYLNLMEVVVHTSVEPEPFGRVLIEAMAMCKPVVGSRGGAVTEIVEEGRTGLTFIPGDPDSLAEAVRRLLLSPHEAVAMGQAGRARLEANFDIRANVRKTEALYASLIS